MLLFLSVIRSGEQTRLQRAADTTSDAEQWVAGKLTKSMIRGIQWEIIGKPTSFPHGFGPADVRRRGGCAKSKWTTDPSLPGHFSGQVLTLFIECEIWYSDSFSLYVSGL